MKYLKGFFLVVDIDFVAYWICGAAELARVRDPVPSTTPSAGPRWTGLVVYGTHVGAYLTRPDEESPVQRAAWLGAVLMNVLACGNAREDGESARPAQSGTDAAGSPDSSDASMRGASDAGDPDASHAPTTDASDASPRNDGAPESGGEQDAGPYWPLGMNDVTILTPPPTTDAPVLLRASDTAADGSALLPRALYERVATEKACHRADDAGVCLGSGDATLGVLSTNLYEALHLVALRFDLCDRRQPGPCPVAADGQLRLIFQPLLGRGEFFDAGLHAFYSIPRGQLSTAVAALRALARLSAQASDGPLRPSAALSSSAAPDYAEGVRRFVRQYASAAQLFRLTVNAQPETESVRWILRGMERALGEEFHEIPIPGSTSDTQYVALLGTAAYDVQPGTNTPAGLAAALRAADDPSEGASRDALLAVENPLLTGTDTVSCVACHTSTVLFAGLVERSGGAVERLQGGYTSSYDLSIDAGVLPRHPRTLRALGYTTFAKEPLISTRVVNETAQVLSEIEQRFH